MQPKPKQNRTTMIDRRKSLNLLSLLLLLACSSSVASAAAEESGAAGGRGGGPSSPSSSGSTPAPTKNESDDENSDDGPSRSRRPGPAPFYSLPTEERTSITRRWDEVEARRLKREELSRARPPTDIAPDPRYAEDRTRAEQLLGRIKSSNDWGSLEGRRKFADKFLASDPELFDGEFGDRIRRMIEENARDEHEAHVELMDLVVRAKRRQQDEKESGLVREEQKRKLEEKRRRQVEEEEAKRVRKSTTAEAKKSARDESEDEAAADDAPAVEEEEAKKTTRDKTKKPDGAPFPHISTSMLGPRFAGEVRKLMRAGRENDVPAFVAARKKELRTKLEKEAAEEGLDVKELVQRELDRVKEEYERDRQAGRTDEERREEENEAAADDAPAVEEEAKKMARDEVERLDSAPLPPISISMLGPRFAREARELMLAGREEEIPAFADMRKRELQAKLEKEAAEEGVEVKEMVQRELGIIRKEYERDLRAVKTDEERAQEAIQAKKDREKYERIRAEQEKEKERQERERQQQQQQQPSSQPTNVHGAYEYSYQRRYDELFRPRSEEYDLVRFDPYSLSGAPLGGWGRATRSRLATLPIRLVSDYDGGMDLWYNSNDGADADYGDGDSNDDGDGEKSGGPESTKESKSSSDDEEVDASEKPAPRLKASSSVAKDLRPSMGPHFSIHDATGQRYVCRAYDEDELVVLSRVDSAFHPAITVWDSALGGGEGAGQDALAEEALKRLEESEEGDGTGVHVRKKFQFSISGQSGGVDGDLPDGVRSSVAGMLRRMGMNDAAAALMGGHLGGGEDVEVEVVIMDDEAGAAREELGEIIRAAAMGAGAALDAAKNDGGGAGDGVAKKAVDAKEGGSEEGGGGGSDESPPASSPGMPAQMTPEEVHRLLSKLDGLCSQLHMGWWSYEWCHREKVRQFHVAVSENAGERGRSFAIQDVTIVGTFANDMQIIYPAGVYDGVYKRGTTQSVKYNKGGKVLRATTSTHTHEDDRIYALPAPPRDDGGLDLLHGKQQQKRGDGERTTGYERGPVIRQSFDGGAFCPSAHYSRAMTVELRCCTEDEIDRWLRAKRQDKGGDKKEKTPLAVLVGVQEDKTCVYRSRVCTPLLCPEPVAAPATDSLSSSSAAAAASEDGAKTTPTTPTEERKEDPMGALLRALLGDDLAFDNFGQVQVFFPDAVVGQEFDELIRAAENGGDFLNHPSFERVKKALGKSGGKKMNVKDLFGDGGDDAGGGGGGGAPSVADLKEGSSIRDMLKKTLGIRPCLLKNLGWWTYEFCYGKNIRQYHSNNLIDSNTGFSKQVIESEHLLGLYADSGNDVEDYPNDDEHLHVINATDHDEADAGVGGRARRGPAAASRKDKRPGGNGAVYVQEYSHGDACDQDDVAESVIKGGNVLHGSVERSSTVRFSCGKRSEMIDVKEDSTCHYVLDVTVPELCQHRLFRAEVTKTQVVKCLPV